LIYLKITEKEADINKIKEGQVKFEKKKCTN